MALFGSHNLAVKGVDVGDFDGSVSEFDLPGKMKLKGLGPVFCRQDVNCHLASSNFAGSGNGKGSRGSLRVNVGQAFSPQLSQSVFRSRPYVEGRQRSLDSVCIRYTRAGKIKYPPVTSESDLQLAEVSSNRIPKRTLLIDGQLRTVRLISPFNQRKLCRVRPNQLL